MQEGEKRELEAQAGDLWRAWRRARVYTVFQRSGTGLRELLTVQGSNREGSCRTCELEMMTDYFYFN